MEVEKYMTKCLQSGFAGETKPIGVYRSSFPMQGVRFYEFDSEGRINRYLDEWTQGRLGGGQELGHTETEDGEEDMTRLYAGGTLSPEELSALGITKKQVLSYVKKQIEENGEKTRLFEDFEPEAEGDWLYAYKIMDYDPKFELYVGKETVCYKGALVFVHQFLLSPVK